MSSRTLRLPFPALSRCAAAISAAFAAFTVAVPALAQEAGEPLETVTVTGNWLGSGLQNSVKNFAGARTVVQKEDIDATGAANIGDVLRRIPGVQSTDNSGTAGSAISLNIGVRGLAGRYSPRSTILLDGVPLAVAPYGQPQLSFAPVSLNNIEAIDVVRGGGAVRYGPQNVGGIINFTTRSIPEAPGIAGDASVRYNHFGEGGHSTQYSAFVGSQLDNGFGVALLYSGIDGSGWREGSDEKVNDFAVKFRYLLDAGAQIYGKLSYYDVKSMTPGGLTVAQYDANPFQNTRPTDYWDGDRKGIDLGYLNTISTTQEAEVKVYYNESSRSSALINAGRTAMTYQPRNYQVLGVEPRYTQRVKWGAATHDVTAGYRYLRERGDDNNYTVTVATGVQGATATFDNETDAHALYVDDRIAYGAWRITPGVRFEKIDSLRTDRAGGRDFDTSNDKALPSLNVAYLVDPALTVFANYGTSFGPVQNTQLNSQTAANPLKPELAKTVELGARWKARGLAAEATLYRLRFDNQILQVPGSTPATFRNIGATRHEGIETAVDYRFDGALEGFNVYANWNYTKAIQESGNTAGLDVPFYARRTGTVGARYETGAFSAGLSATAQSRQFSDAENTIAETANGGVGSIPGFGTVNGQVGWKLPGRPGVQLLAGVNNLADKRYYTRNVDGNLGRMVAAPRTAWVQARMTF
ncbi:TonB-dependent receptor family protein [Pseudoduganella umbonata]|uniref:Fe(3+) dicitrate transport protein n=1 Tax=Pseudoduganella umbonata TaxID=864828 RepID=A0A4P8HTU6_9BURK|nr:TonB-dependent siderophore receptor [Pseudoduganella umbonata]MBB3220287.1 Fe(3+) dicitrate transport protein [Pseudoduganella umbonata]QCP12172.1 TonB-dependent siderophore receptor [Pseudoduganella umbonata]